MNSAEPSIDREKLFREKLDWRAAFGAGGPLWEVISSLNQLSSLCLDHPSLHASQDFSDSSTNTFPRITPPLQLLISPNLSLTEELHAEQTKSKNVKEPVVGNGGWGLGEGWDNLKDLKIGPLSETGAKTIASHLTLLANHTSKLTGFAVETQFLDALMCRSITRLGSLGSLQHIELSTSGTRLTAECLNTIITGCVSLQSLKLNGVDDTWSIIKEWPQSFVSLEIVIPEFSKRFSWILDHLDSIHCLPFTQLQHFAVRREIHSVHLLLSPPPNTTVLSPCRSDMALRAIPSQLLQVIKDNGQNLRSLCLDCWEIDQQDLVAILAKNINLRTLEVSYSGSVAQALNIPNSFSKLPLERLVDYIDIPSDLPTSLRDRMSEADPNLLDPRDLKKFARRLPQLKSLKWGGKGGRGLWQFSRKSSHSNLINIHFTHAVELSQDIWLQCQQPAPYTYGDIIESPSPRSALEVTTMPTTPTSAISSLSRAAINEADDIVQTPRTRQSSFEADAVAMKTGKSDTFPPLVAASSPVTPSHIKSPMEYKCPTPAKHYLPKISKTSTAQGNHNVSPKTPARSSFPASQSIQSRPAPSPQKPQKPQKPQFTPGSGYSNPWIKSNQVIREDSCTPRVIPGSGGRLVQSAETIGGGLRQAVPAVKQKEIVKKQPKVVKPVINHGWTVVGGVNRLTKDGKSKKSIPGTGRN
ncbi:uncharacterized protein L201_001274 [Kwoniella dendrophila CBS 6074]|uniref:F-box domain-containing protein n=1 Tax=Kwoniella dendrophila CBS 6074 TaxID=1295534 RepID=A0AAX4JPL3_9TREE